MSLLEIKGLTIHYETRESVISSVGYSVFERLIFVIVVVLH